MVLNQLHLTTIIGLVLWSSFGEYTATSCGPVNFPRIQEEPLSIR